MYQKASRLKLRFDSFRGLLTVEDLWDLPLTTLISTVPSLDSLAKGVNRELKATEEESFVVKGTISNEILKLKLDILKDIIQVKLGENEAAGKARENAEKKQRILSLIAQKEDGVLAETSLEELRKMAETL